MNTANGEPGINICLDVGVTHTRAWAVRSGNILAKAKVLEGIRGSITRSDRLPALNAIRKVIGRCLEQIDDGTSTTAVDFISAAGMITSELGPFPVPHIQGPAGTPQLSEHVARRDFATDKKKLPLFLVPGIRFGSNHDYVSSDAIRGEETLVIGMLGTGLLAPGDALLNLGSHWKVILTNSASEIMASHTGMAGELILAVSRQTILKSNLPDARPKELLADHIKTGRDRYSRYGLARTLFLLRMDTQRNGLSDLQAYWQLAGALIEDTLVGLRLSLGGLKRLGISGYLPLAHAWAGTLSELGIEARVFSEGQIESSFCAGLKGIVNLHRQKLLVSS